VIELIDDWGKRKPVLPAPRGSRAPKPLSPEAIRDSLAAVEPQILNVYCFEDVQYPWVQVVFDEVITPAAALRVGTALATVIPAQYIYFNSLRPRAVYFVLDLADPKPDLKASRYGTLLADIEAAWNPPAKGGIKRAAR
jgi:hypothetical protein